MHSSTYTRRASRDHAMMSGTLGWLPVILDAEHLDPTETLLLVALADHVDSEDRCYVGIDTLARRARVSYVTARRRIASLESRHVIERSRRRRDDGNLSVYDYTLCREAFGLPPLNLSGDHRSPGRAVTSAHHDERAEPPRVEPPRSELSLTLDDAATAPARDVVAEGFEEFWSAYPRHSAKGNARKAWQAAVRRAGGVDVIVEGAARYAADPNRDDRFTAHAATWLNGERWLDPPLPSRTGRPATTGPRRVVAPDEEARRRAAPAGRITNL